MNTLEVMSSEVPAGWYADPSIPGVQRYWDGQQWTSHTDPADLSAIENSRTRARRIMNVSLGATLGLLAVSVLVLLLTAGDLVNCGDHGNLTENRKTLWECRSVVEDFLGYQPSWADSLSRAITVVIGPLLTIVAVVLTVVRMSNHRFRPDSTTFTVRAIAQMTPVPLRFRRPGGHSRYRHNRIPVRFLLSFLARAKRTDHDRLTLRRPLGRQIPVILVRAAARGRLLGKRHGS